MTEEIFQKDPYAGLCKAVVTEVATDDNWFSTDRTVFYARGGGQPGDVGFWLSASGRSNAIIDTVRNRETGAIQHMVKDQAILPAPGDPIQLCIDWDRRYRLMRMHSCLHFLCAVISAPVTGGQIHDGRGRLDFNMAEPLVKRDIEFALNKVIQNGSVRKITWITDEELEATPWLVKTMSVQPPKGLGMIRLINFDGVDIQPCGGTHVKHSSEIGRVRIEKIEKKGRHNRRVTVALEK